MKGISAGGIACIVGMVHFASMALAETVPEYEFNATVASNATLATNRPMFDEGEDWVDEGDPLPLEGRSNNGAMQLDSLFDEGEDWVDSGDPLALKGQSNGGAMELKRQRIGKKKIRRNAKASKSRKGKQSKRNKRPNKNPSNGRPGQSRPGTNPASCFSEATYDAIDDDISSIKNSFRDDKSRSHFLGGIVRLAAHDFMDYDRRDARDPMGMDGCYDVNHPSNDGLESVWCRDCPLRLLYEGRYGSLSRADFWVAAANAVIRQTSVRNALNLKETFLWGRRDRASCRGSGERLPVPDGCGEIEGVFLKRMGLEWRDAVALLGAHTLGRGDRDFSGHHGTWVDSDQEAQIFDKAYYEALFTNSWRPRNMGRKTQDWTTGRGGGSARMMLNTDMCLVFDIDQNIDRRIPCCTNTDGRYPDGTSRCVDREAARRRCPMYSRQDARRSATDAVRDMLGGSVTSRDNGPFYIAFARAWRKATTAGQNDLVPLRKTCERT